MVNISRWLPFQKVFTQVIEQDNRPKNQVYGDLRDGEGLGEIATIHPSGFRGYVSKGADLSKEAVTYFKATKIHNAVNLAADRAKNWAVGYGEDFTNNGSYDDDALNRQSFDADSILYGSKWMGREWQDAKFAKTQSWTDACIAGAKFPGADFSEANLMGVLTTHSSQRDKKIDVQRANFYKANLSGLRLGDFDFKDAKLKGAVLAGCDFEGAKLSKEQLEGAIILNDRELDDALISVVSKSPLTKDELELLLENKIFNLRGADLSGIKNLKQILSPYLEKDIEIDFTNASFAKGTDLSAMSELYKCIFDNALLDGVNFSASKINRIKQAVLDGANLDRADLSGVDAEAAVFENASFLGANLNKAKLSNARFAGAKLEGANFSDAELADASFSNNDDFDKSFAKFLQRQDLDREDLENFYVNAQTRNAYEQNIVDIDIDKLDSQRIKSGISLEGLGLAERKVSFLKTKMRDVDLGQDSYAGINFRGARLSKDQLKNAKFHYRSAAHRAFVKLFAQENLSEANLKALLESGVRDFSYARIIGDEEEPIDFAKLIKPYAASTPLVFDGATLENLNFNGADLKKSSFEDVNCKNLSFDKADLTAANCSRSYFRHCSFNKTQLTEVNLQRSYLYESDLAKANTKGAKMQGIRVRKSKLLFRNYADISPLDLAETLKQHIEELPGDKNLQSLLKEHSSLLPQEELKSGHGGKTNYSKSLFVPGIDLRNLHLGQKHIDLREAVLIGANLQGQKLSGAMLAGVDLRGSNLQNADLRGMDLRGVDFTDADLRGANFANANLDGAILDTNRLKGANFNEVALDNIIFSGNSAVDKSIIKYLKNKRLGRAEASHLLSFGIHDWQGVKFRPCSLRGLKLSEYKVNLADSDLVKVNLADEDLSAVNLRGANLHKANIKGVKFSNDKEFDSSLRRLFSGEMLKEADLKTLFANDWYKLRKDVIAPQVNAAKLFSGKTVDLSEASLHGLDFSQKFFKRVNAEGLDADNSELRWKETKDNAPDYSRLKFYKADLEGAIFNGVDLSGLDMRKARLTKAKFANAKLDKTDLRGAGPLDAIAGHYDLRRAILDDNQKSYLSSTPLNIDSAELNDSLDKKILSIKAELEEKQLKILLQSYAEFLHMINIESFSDEERLLITNFTNKTDSLIVQLNSKDFSNTSVLVLFKSMLRMIDESNIIIASEDEKKHEIIISQEVQGALASVRKDLLDAIAKLEEFEIVPVEPGIEAPEQDEPKLKPKKDKGGNLALRYAKALSAAVVIGLATSLVFATSKSKEPKKVAILKNNDKKDTDEPDKDPPKQTVKPVKPDDSEIVLDKDTKDPISLEYRVKPESGEKPGYTVNIDTLSPVKTNRAEKFVEDLKAGMDRQALVDKIKKNLKKKRQSTFFQTVDPNDRVELDLRRHNMSKKDLTGLPLSYVRFDDSSLRKANLRGAVLRGGNFRGANLQDADFTGADLRDTYIDEGTNLQGANWRGAALGTILAKRLLKNKTYPQNLDIGLRKSELSEKLEKERLQILEQVKKEIKDARQAGRSPKFEGLDLSGIKFGDIDLTGAEFIKCKLNQTIFKNTILTSTTFSEANFEDVIFDKAILTAAKIVDSRFEGTLFSDSILSSIKIETSGFRSCKFLNSILSEAVMNKVRLDSSNIFSGGVVLGMNIQGPGSMFAPDSMFSVFVDSPYRKSIYDLKRDSKGIVWQPYFNRGHMMKLSGRKYTYRPFPPIELKNNMSYDEYINLANKYALDGRLSTASASITGSDSDLTMDMIGDRTQFFNNFMETSAGTAPFNIRLASGSSGGASKFFTINANDIGQPVTIDVSSGTPFGTEAQIPKSSASLVKPTEQEPEPAQPKFWYFDRSIRRREEELVNPARFFVPRAYLDILVSEGITDFKGILISPEANMKGLNLKATDWSNAVLAQVNLEKQDLSEAKFVNTDLNKANLQEVKLLKANLSGAKLRGANLFKAVLVGAKLNGADLSETKLIGANLDNVDLSNAKIDTAIFDSDPRRNEQIINRLKQEFNL